MANSTTTRPRFGPIVTLTRVSRWSESSSSSSSNPAGAAGAPGRARGGGVRLAGGSRRAAADRLLDRRGPTGPRRRARRATPPGRRGRACRAAPARGRRAAGFGDQLLDRRRELEEPERVGDRRRGSCRPGGRPLVGEPEVLDQLLVRRRLLERVEVLAMEVLDQRLLERRSVSSTSGRWRASRQPGPLAARHRRSPATSW